MAGINTTRANPLVREAIESSVIMELQGYDDILSEVKYGDENSRIDFLLRAQGRRDCYLEVKSVTLEAGEGLGIFPDSVSARGTKHLRELMAMHEQGYRAVLLFCVQHTGINTVSPADDIDPMYGETLREAIKVGVEVLAYGASIDPTEILVDTKLKVVIP